MTYVIHGSFSISNINVTDYEAKLYDLCRSYSGENIYVSYENMNSVESNNTYRRINKTKPLFVGTLEVRFHTTPTTPNTTPNTIINNNQQHNQYHQDHQGHQDHQDHNLQHEFIDINLLCKCLKQLQRNKVIIDMIYDETNNSSLYKSLQLRKQSYSEYETYKSKKRINVNNVNRQRSYTESEVLLLNSLKKKSQNVPTYEEYLSAINAIDTISPVTNIPPLHAYTPMNTPNMSRASSPNNDYN